MSDNQREPRRRPIAAMFRLTAHRATDWCVKKKIHPNWISYASIVFAGSASICLAFSSRHPIFLLLGSFCCVARLWCNMLDGMVAIAGNSTSPTGEIANEFPDRISDILILVGVAHVPGCNTILGYWAAIMALLTAYTGVLGQAVGAAREFGGIMSKPWRMAVVIIAAIVQFIFPELNRMLMHAKLPQVFSIACIVIIAGCVQSIVVRGKRTLKSISVSNQSGDDRIGDDIS